MGGDRRRAKRKRERKRIINVREKFDSCLCPDWGLNLQSFCVWDNVPLKNVYLFSRAAILSYHNWWLKTTNLILSQFLESASLKSRCQQGHIPLEGCREESFLLFLSSCWLPAIFDVLGMQLHHSNLCLHLHVSSPIPKRILVIGFKAHGMTLQYYP